MSEGTDVDDRVDLDEDNYIEETEYDLEEDPEDDRADDNEEQHDEGIPEESSLDGASPEDENKLPTTVGDVESEKNAELLSLPPHGSEVFIGGLPKSVIEKDLEDLCESIGKVSEIRIVKDKDTGEGKGFAFVAFQSKEIAQKAIDEIHNKEFRGKTLRCSLSETKNRLFIGNIPKSWVDEEFRKIVEEVGPGVEIVELIKDPQNPSRNRGFAFVLYYNNACAEYSRQKMSSSSFKLDGNTPTVSWADPKGSPSEQSAAASQVKALYVKNIPENTTTEKMKELFQRHGEVIKVVMPPGKAGKRDFGFIHYAERSSALKAVKDSEKYEIDGQMLEVVLAKPQAEKKVESGHSHPHPHTHPGAYPGPPQYSGYSGTSYGSVGRGFGGFQQPVIYGRGPMPSGMHMVPMVLPDGRIGYVLQQPGVQMPQVRPRRVDRSSRLGGGGDDGHRSKRYRPY